jgi:transcriptional regulator with XRE-family HTH domain
VTEKQREIGQRIRAYRMGAGLSSEEAARRLQISRAALYKYERTGVVKLETIERLAELVGVPVSTLLGAGTEYFSNAISFFERKRQLERESSQIISYLESIPFLVSSPDYVQHLRSMLLEGLPENSIDRAKARTHIERLMAVMAERHDDVGRGHATVISIIGAVQIERLLRTGLIGTYDLSPSVLEERRLLARQEIERLASLVDQEPIGIQIGVVDDLLPTQTFELFRRTGDTMVAVSPYRLGELPNIRRGVASITAAPEAVSLYEDLAKELWGLAHRGRDAGALLRRIIKRVSPGQPVLRVMPKKK